MQKKSRRPREKVLSMALMLVLGILCFKHSGRGSISGVWLFSYLRRRNGGALYRL